MRIATAMSGAFGGEGIPRVLESWAHMLGASGHDVTVISQNTPKAHPFPTMEGVTQRLSEVPPGAGRRNRLFIEANSVAGILDELRRGDGLDLVISHSSLLSVRIRHHLPSIPLIQTIHSPAVDEHHLTNWMYARDVSKRATYPLTRAMLWQLERRALRSVSHVHTLSDYTWNLMNKRYASVCATVPWRRIPGTFDDARFVTPDDRDAVRNRLGIRPHETVLLTIRRLVPRNGVDRILHCARQLRSELRHVRFLIGGTGELQAELEQGVRGADLGDVVQLLGFIPEEDLVSYYQAADAFVMPTRHLECFGLPVIEGMGCGTPPLVMPDGGPAEICREFPERIAAANTDDAFTDLVRRFLAGEIPRRIDGIDRWARERYSEAAVIPAVLSLVEDALDETGRRSRVRAG